MILTRRQVLRAGLGLLPCARALSIELRPRYVPGEILARVTHPDQRGVIERVVGGAVVEPILGEPLKRSSALVGRSLYRVSLKGGIPLSAGTMAEEAHWFDATSRRLAALGIGAFRNGTITVPLEPLTEFNDPFLREQYYIEAMGFHKLWGAGIVGTRDVPLIVIDTGIQSDHPDLFANLSLSEFRGFYGLGLEDRAGHGTFVAGVGAAVANNGIGGAGVAPGCRLVSLKAVDWVEILGEIFVQGTEAGLLSALYHVLNNYEKAVVVMALGRYEAMPLVAEVIQAGHDQFLIVAAVGNEALFSSSRYPAAYSRIHKNVLSVTAVDRLGYLASFANNNRPTTDIAAYGVGIVSTYINGGYATGSGTSPSAALIGGLTALCWSSAETLGFGLSPAVLKRSVIDSGWVDPRHVQFDPIPVLFDATQVWKRAIGPDVPPRSRRAQVP